MLPPGSTIGMLGGGQLGRMAALAAASLGYHMHIYTPHGDDPAIEVAKSATVAGWDDQAALAEFAEAVDVITLEFENVPVETVAFLSDMKPVLPNYHALAVAQDRVVEKSFIKGWGIATAPWREVNSPAELATAIAEIGLPAFAKTNRLGYDGKGQRQITEEADWQQVWQALGSVPLILEGAVAFTTELSLVMARGRDGAMAFYPLAENQHCQGILHRTIAPAEVSAEIESAAQAIAAKIAHNLNYVGVLAVELFLTGDGQLLVNEIAPRPHNSGHWTIDACQCSQFEQQIRAVCGLPLGSTEPHSRATMLNLIGDDCEGWAKYLADPSACLHLYGKAESRPGRKMGHVTKLERIDAMNKFDDYAYKMEIERLIKFSAPLDEISANFINLSYDYRGDNVVLKSDDIKNIIKSYISLYINENDVEYWANLIEGRNGIQYEAEKKIIISEIIHELANPDLTSPLTKQKAKKLICLL